ncbi:hypothetical protein D1872_215900 [compost metagenome]
MGAGSNARDPDYLFRDVYRHCAATERNTGSLDDAVVLQRYDGNRLAKRRLIADIQHGCRLRHLVPVPEIH